jgi:hypothetical protein
MSRERLRDEYNRSLAGVVAMTAVGATRYRRRVGRVQAALDRVWMRTWPDAPDLREHPEAGVATVPSLIVRYVRWYVPIGCLVTGHTGLVAIIATIVSAALLLIFRRPLAAIDGAYARWWNARVASPRRRVTRLYRGSERLSGWAARTMAIAGVAALFLCGAWLLFLGTSGQAPAAVSLSASIAMLTTFIGALMTFASMMVMVAVPTLLGPTSQHDLLLDSQVLATLRPVKETFVGRMFDFVVELGKALRRL